MIVQSLLDMDHWSRTASSGWIRPACVPVRADLHPSLESQRAPHLWKERLIEAVQQAWP
jgi:hypothetical protein